MNDLQKSFLRNSILPVMAISVIFLLVSCSPPNEKAHPAFNKAGEAFKEQNYNEAAARYQEYLDFNRKSSLTHSKLAKLYGDYLDDPFLAAYHYRQYLVYEPESSDREAIEAWITAANKRFATQIQKQYPKDFTSITEVTKLKDDKRRLINYAIKMKKQNAFLLKKLHGETNFGTGTKSRERVVAGEGMQEVYTVKSGDNLQKISRSVYGTPKHYRLIFDANRSTLKSESQLQIGQKLQIPKLKKTSGATPRKREIEADSEETTEVIIDYPAG